VTHLAAGARLLIAALVLAALVINAVAAAQYGLLAQNLSYFTTQSNLFFAIALLAWTLPGARRSAWFDHVRGAVAFYLVITGLVYALLIAPLDELLRWDIGWTGIVQHRLAPLAALAEWLLVARRRAAPARRILWWQLYPALFIVLTWVRGGVTTWYPYAFLDPTASSWSQVLTTTAMVMVAFFAVGAAMHLLEGRLAPRGSPVRSPQPAAP
jgi:hypothetical protein